MTHMRRTKCQFVSFCTIVVVRRKTTSSNRCSPAAVCPFGMTYADIGKGFIDQYYAIFGTNRAQCQGIYRETSVMTWSGENLAGVANIMTKFASLPFNQARFNPTEVVYQPINQAGILVVANGECVLEGESHTLAFNDVFHLALDATGQWYVANQVFRILGGGSH